MRVENRKSRSEILLRIMGEDQARKVWKMVKLSIVAFEAEIEAKRPKGPEVDQVKEDFVDAREPPSMKATEKLYQSGNCPKFKIEFTFVITYY